MSPTRLHPADLRELAKLLRESDNMRIRDAAKFLGVSRDSVERFMRVHPACVVVDAQGIRRIPRKWLEAWTEGRNVVAALERAEAA